MENAALLFSVFVFFQQFDRKIIDKLSDIVKLYKNSELSTKQMAVFFIKSCYVGIMKILKIGKKLFLRPVF